MATDGTDDQRDPKTPGKPESYEPPAILWEEPFEPVALAMSCNHQQLNPGCDPGPYGS